MATVARAQRRLKTEGCRLNDPAATAGRAGSETAAVGSSAKIVADTGRPAADSLAVKVAAVRFGNDVLKALTAVLTWIESANTANFDAAVPLTSFTPVITTRDTLTPAAAATAPR